MENNLKLEIDTGLMIGKGLHPTTVLCLKLIDRYLVKGDKILDVGTGSGILMIAAARLGAGNAIGIDNNEAAVEMARKNLWLNKIPRKRYAVRSGNLLDGVEDHFDLVVANLLPRILTRLVDDLPRVLTPGGTFVCAGMLEGNTHRVAGKMRSKGFIVMETRINNKWAALAGRLTKLTNSRNYR
jgi:ribosomal protein L11 methyltransferase